MTITTSDFQLLGREYSGSTLFWLGGTDIGHEGTWIWESSVEPVDDFVWDENEPGSGITYNCMAWYRKDSVDKAIDYDCDHSFFYPLCQIPI